MTDALPAYLTLQEVADLARCHYETARQAAVEYDRTSGKSGLKSSRRNPRGPRRVVLADARRWIEGHKPAKGTRRPAAVAS